MHIVIRTIGLLSLTGGITFLLFCFLQLSLNKKVSARWQSRALLLLTLFWLVPIGSVYPQEHAIVYKNQFNIPVVHARPQQTVIAVDTMTTAVDSSWLVYGYCLVAVICFLRFLCQYRRQCRYLRQTSWAITGDDEQRLFCALLHQQQITNVVQLRCSPVIKAPILVGLRNYQILLPNHTLQTEQFKLILSHELAHVKNYDNCQKIYLEVLKCVFWFHPCIYWLKRMADNLCELACDEQVVRDFNTAQRKQYGFLLLELVQKGQAMQLGCSGFHAKGVWLKKRLLHIVNYQKMKKSVCCLFLCCFCLICAAGCGVSSAVEQQLPETAAAVEEVISDKAPTLADGVAQKNIATFSWENGGSVWTTLQINGEAYQISGSGESPEDFLFRPQELLQYWQALKALPPRDIPENLNNMFNYELTLQDELDAANWRAQQKPIRAVSWEKRTGTDQTTLWINGEEYSYQILDSGELVISAGTDYYWHALKRLSSERLPEDLYEWLAE